MHPVLATILLVSIPCSLFASPETPFRRGDADASGSVELTDGVVILRRLFGGEGTLPCLAAADIDTSGGIDLTDPIFLFAHLFLGREAPSAPFPWCGSEPTPGKGVPCDTYIDCGEEAMNYDAVEMPDTELSGGAVIGFHDGEPRSPEDAGSFRSVIALLAPGESLLALSEFPDFDTTVGGLFEEGGGAVVASGLETYEPGIQVTQDTDESGCGTLDTTLLERIDAALKANRPDLARERFSLRGAFPTVVCGLGEHDVLLVEENAAGRTRLRAARFILRRSDGAYPKLPVILVRGQLPPEPGTGPCRWFGAQAYSPAGREVSASERTIGLLGAIHAQTATFAETPPEGGHDGVLRFSGPGPWHALFARRGRANCLTPQTALAASSRGSLLTHLSFLCLDSEGTVTSKDNSLYKTEVEVQTSYASSLDVSATSGLGCPLVPDSVRAHATDEIKLVESDQLMFHKALTLGRGNEISTSVRYALGVDASFPKAAGGAVSLPLRFGYAEDIKDFTGARSEELSVLQRFQTQKPRTVLHLESSGNIELSARHRTGGSTRIITDHFYLAYVGIASPTEKGRALDLQPSRASGYVAAALGDPVTRMREKLEEIENFFQANGVDGTLPLPKDPREGPSE